MIPQHKIEEVFETARIEEVVSDFVQLKRSGQNLKGLSPWVNEKTPSFMVSPAKQIFKDFSSGKGGNVVTFLMEVEHFSYPEALRWLAKRYNIDLEEEAPSAEAVEERNEREQLYLLNQFAQKYFTSQMTTTDEGKSVALGYFKQRDFNQKTINSFQLGYNPDRWDAFLNHAKENGYSEDLLVTSGLVKKKGDRLYDGYKGRVMFPILNLSGRVLGFGGRVLDSNAKTAKYINSPQSIIYDKSKTLYGMYQAKSAIVREDRAVLVEGYTDVMRLHQQGIENAVASSGTSLTKDQISLLRRYSKNVLVLFDGDQAGLKAALRGMDLLLEEGMNVKILPLPDGSDPDSFAADKEVETLNAYFSEHQKDFISFKSAFLLKESGDDPLRKAEVVKSVVASIALIPEAIHRSIYLKECSKLLNVEESVLVLELNKARRIQTKQRAQRGSTQHEADTNRTDTSEEYLVNALAPKQEAPALDDIESQERDVLRIALNYPSEMLRVAHEESDEVEEVSVLDVVLDALLEDEYSFKNPAYQHLFEALIELREKEEQVPGRLVHDERKEVRELVADLVTNPHHLHDWEKRFIYVNEEKDKLERMIFGALHALQSRHILKMIKETQLELKSLDNSPDSEIRIMELLKHLKELEEVKMAINRKLGRIII